MTKRIGIDVGGTFTDFVMLDRDTGGMVHHKEPSTPAAPSMAVASGLKSLLSKGKANAADVELIVHGTTLSLNALLQRHGVAVALLTSHGAKDILELARIRMTEAYDFFATPDRPMVERQNVLELTARVSAAGEVVALPSNDELDKVASTLASMDVQVAVISLINGYANPGIEHALANGLRARLPTMPFVAATEIWSEIREYERTMIAVMNGYIEPIMRVYYDRLEALLAEQPPMSG
ncbi:hydantoinase/oxoprolinase N-terminal domain-containing protein [Robbsia andropogonis]|uniref:hydantoinase/oxoprolinase N-terminal domain-containing protein n=1 Tax=Robbsia andropogonis TaxID=28092 RepID=UPI003D1CB9FA